MPTALSSVPRHADIARRLVLASRLPSRAEPALNPHSACCLAGAQLSATSCLGAFWTPASCARGSFVLPASKNQHKSTILNHGRWLPVFHQEQTFSTGRCRV